MRGTLAGAAAKLFGDEKESISIALNGTRYHNGKT